MEQGGQHLGGNLTVFFAVVAPAGYDARQVVVVPEQTVPALAVELCLPLVHDFLELKERQRAEIPFGSVRVLIQTDMLKLEDHGHLAAVRITV